MRKKRKVDKKEVKKASAACMGGAALGASTHATIGGAGLVATGSAVSIGLLAFIGIGVVVGLAGYGVYRVVTSRNEND